jgi:hypothetical protein
MKALQNLDYPKIGKIILIIMSTIEATAYLYLTVEYHNESTGFTLAILLFFTAVSTLFLAIASLIPKIYYNYTVAYVAIAVFAIILRIVGMIALNRSNDSQSEEFYMTEDGFICFMQSALVF